MRNIEVGQNPTFAFSVPSRTRLEISVTVSQLCRFIVNGVIEVVLVKSIPSNYFTSKNTSASRTKVYPVNNLGSYGQDRLESVGLCLS